MIVVHAFGEPEVLRIERGRQLPVANGQRDVIQGHGSIIARRRGDRPHAMSSVGRRPLNVGTAARSLCVVLKLLLGATLLAAATAPIATAGPSTGMGEVDGRIIDVTCYGPCAPGTNPRPFEGHVDVVVTDRKTGQQVARVSVKGSRYSLIVPPGRYRIVAVPLPEQDSNCWQGDPRRLHVVAGQSERRRLKVENVCVQ